MVVRVRNRKSAFATLVQANSARDLAGHVAVSFRIPFEPSLEYLHHCGIFAGQFALLQYGKLPATLRRGVEVKPEVPDVVRHAFTHASGADGDAWQIDIPAGASQGFAAAYDHEGNRLSAGTYGNAASGASFTRYASHFPNGGKISVRPTGLALSVR